MVGKIVKAPQLIDQHRGLKAAFCGKGYFVWRYLHPASRCFSPRHRQAEIFIKQHCPDVEQGMTVKTAVNMSK